MKRLGIPAILILWAVLNLWPLVTHPDQGPMPRVIQDSDFIITHLPIATYVHDSIQQFGQIPLWNSAIMSGQPFAADPLSGYWYLPNWLVYWQPEPWMFTLLFLLHLAWTGWGVYRLMINEGVQAIAACFAAMVWMATPKLIGYIGGGQVSIVFALAWTPWLLITFRQAAKQPGLRSGALASACLAITFLADVRWGLFGGALALIYGLVNFRFNRQNIFRIMPVVSIMAILILVLIAGQALPMLEFMGFSRRADLTLNDQTIFAIEPLSFLGLIFAQYGLIYEMVIYLGIGTVVLAIFGLIRRQWFWSTAALVAALFAMGTYTFIYPALITIIPGISWLRVPSRAWFIVAFGAAALAGWGLEGILNNLHSLRLPKWTAPMAVIAIFTISAANLLWYNSSQLFGYQLPESKIQLWLESQPGTFRVYSPDGRIPMPNRLQQANGVNPMHLANYASYLGTASGMNLSGYSVSLPNIYIDQKTPPDIVVSASRPNATQLGLLNVKYLVSKLPLQADGIILAQTFGDTKVYENLLARPRAWLDGGSVDITYWSPDRIEVASTGSAGTLVLSEIMYPGWHAWVDGKPVNVETVDGLLRGVELTAGKHQVVFEFRPLTVIIGAAISLAGWIAFIFIMAFNRKKHIERNDFSS